MIVTLTPNPSLDRTIEIPELHRGEVHRATGGRVDPGGKGVNVSRALAACDIATDRRAAVGRAGGRPARGAARPVRRADRAGADQRDGAQQHHRRRARRDDHQAQRGRSRAQRRTRPRPSSARWSSWPARASWVVGSGSLPRGLGDDFYARLVTALRDHDTQVCIDASGPPLAAAVDAGPDLIKPNAEELAELVGRPLRRLGDVVEACTEIRKRGVATVLVSLGGDGALLVNADEVLHGWAPPVKVRSTVGAGDSTLAGYLAGGGRGRAALVTAIAYGTAAVQLPGSVMPRPTDLDPDAVVVTDNPDLDRALS